MVLPDSGKTSCCSSSDEGGRNNADRGYPRYEFTGRSPVVAGGTPVLRRIGRNVGLEFEKPDDSSIHIPSLQENAISYIVTNYVSFPEGSYRIIDYTRAALTVFTEQARSEYRKQRAKVKDNVSTKLRCTWGNKSNLAISYAACCDMLKLLYDMIEPVSRPKWDDAVRQFINFLVSHPALPADVFSKETYYTKFLDWRRGGTRYQTSNCATNVRFPSVSQRRKNIENYLKCGMWVNMETISVVTISDTGEATRSDSTGGVTISLSCSNAQGERLQGWPPAAMIRRGVYMKLPVSPPNASNMRDSIIRNNSWREELMKVVGGASINLSKGLPEGESRAVPDFVCLCETSEAYNHVEEVMNIIVSSTESSQKLFEENNGISVLRSFVGRAEQDCNSRSLFLLVQKLLEMKLQSWGEGSCQSWLHDLDSCEQSNLDWLRDIKTIPPTQRKEWIELVEKLEERYVHMPLTKYEGQQEYDGHSCAGSGESRQHGSGTNKESRRKQGPLFITNSRCKRLSEEVCTPQGLDTGAAVAEFISRKFERCEEAQGRWRDDIHNTFGCNLSDAPVLCWYDPRQLLGLTPYTHV